MLTKSFPKMSFRACWISVLLLSTVSIVCAQNAQTQIDPRIAEVYGNTTTQLNAEQLAWINNQLSRCEILQEPVTAGETYTLISELPLVKKYVPQLTADSVISIQTFNPLKYAIDFHKKVDVKYRIDGTDYILLVRKKL